MKILITGNMGYVGSALTGHLRRKFPSATIVGFDSGFFGHCLTAADHLPEAQLSRQVFGDMRDFPFDLLDGIDSVVHLAAVSNDPMGNKYEAVTEAINQAASVRLAETSASKGVKNFVFASSCSMYGYAEGGARRETDPTNPLTAYARSKIGTETHLKNSELGQMVVTNLRFATACGMSARLRLDLVLNDFVACAFSSGKITVLSDGTPWRPLIDVTDMARAIEWGVARSSENGGQMLSVNIGKDEWNFQVRDLANAVAKAVPAEVSINLDAPPDKRSYKVDFSLFKSLAPEHQPIMTLETSIDHLVRGMKAMEFTNTDFRNSTYMRLKMLERHIASGALGDDLHWTSH